MKKVITILCAIAVLAGGMATPAGAALTTVGPVNAATGYPVWYGDVNNLRLDLCLDQNGMCLAALSNPAARPVVPGNWDPAGEAFYYMAVATIPDPRVDASLELALEAGFVGAVAKGGQAVFTRFRVCINPRDPVAANSNFTITHPFGASTLLTRNVNQNTCDTVDVPGLVAGDFTTALTTTTLGPFLRPAAAPGGAPLPFVLVPNPDGSNNAYLSTPGSLVKVTGGTNPLNNFVIAGPITLSTDDFDIQAKVSTCAPLLAVGMVPPVAVADPVVGAATGQAKVVTVIGNDTPGTAPGFPCGAAVIPAIDPGSVAVTLPVGGTAVANANGTVTFTSNPAFTGTGSFTYTVQDACGQATLAQLVNVTVEQLTATKAEFRARTGKWTVTGTTSNTTANTITLRKGDTATGPVIGTANAQADGTWKFIGKSKTAPASPAAPQNINVQSTATADITAPLKMR